MSNPVDNKEVRIVTKFTSNFSPCTALHTPLQNAMYERSDHQYNYTLPVCYVHVHPANRTWQLLQLWPRLWRADEPLPLWWADEELLPLWSCLLPVPPGANPAAADRSPALPSAAAGAWGPLPALSRWLGPFSGWPWFTALASAPTAFLPGGGLSKCRPLTSLAVRANFWGISSGSYGRRSAMMQEWLSRCCARLEWNGMGWNWSGSLFVLDGLGDLYICSKWRSRCHRNLSTILFSLVFVTHKMVL